jgi:hypothetical protein
MKLLKRSDSIFITLPTKDNKKIKQLHILFNYSNDK